MANYFGVESKYLDNLKVKDSEYHSHAADCFTAAKRIDAVVDRYLDTLEDLSDAMEGNLAKNMATFHATAKAYLDEVIHGIYSSMKSDMQGYISELDSADGTLY